MQNIISKNELHEMLNDAVKTKIMETAEEHFTKISDLPSIDEVKIIRRTHAVGGITRMRKAKNDGEKTKLTGKSKAIRRMQGIKLHKTLKKQTGAKKRIKAFKFKKAMRKKGRG